ncbi:unnamed protein product [Tenebrio molitor]|nr:unnamed protein product [Tenebrio molitor]
MLCIPQVRRFRSVSSKDKKLIHLSTDWFDFCFKFSLKLLPFLSFLFIVVVYYRADRISTSSLQTAFYIGCNEIRSNRK